MGSWMFDMLMVVIAVTAMGYVFFKLAFSSSEDARRNATLKPPPRFNRREAERGDRRQKKEPAPEGVERRVGPRR